MSTPCGFFGGFPDEPRVTLMKVVSGRRPVPRTAYTLFIGCSKPLQTLDFHDLHGIFDDRQEPFATRTECSGGNQGATKGDMASRRNRRYDPSAIVMFVTSEPCRAFRLTPASEPGNMLE